MTLNTSKPSVDSSVSLSGREPISKPPAKLKIGIIVNPVAGLGGPAGLKGSDELPDSISSQASRSTERARRALESLVDVQSSFELLCAPSVMGENLLEDLGLAYTVVGSIDKLPCSAGDTETICQQLIASSIDLLVFVGGDGTARNIVNGVRDSVRPEQACLGIPAGVKMHSSVFAINPETAAELIRLLLENGLVDIRTQEVRDIDEALFREGRVSSKFYGELQVPEQGEFLQQTKNSGREIEELVLADIGAYVVEELEPDTYYFIGPGSTPKCVLDELGLPATLLGFDVLHNEELVASDVDADALLSYCQQAPGRCVAIITAIGGQGHLIGRGNQQLSPQVLKCLGRDNIRVLATKTKITELQRRPLLIDSNDAEIDKAWSGRVEVITGYRDKIYYSLSCGYL